MCLGYIPSSVMIPQRRFATLLDQARIYQQSQCLYHNAPTNPRNFSLYTDHFCDENAFPRVTTTILDGHTDEVWNLEWSHSGNFLATASRDKTAIIWRVGVSYRPSLQLSRSVERLLMSSQVNNRSLSSRLPRTTYPSRASFPRGMCCVVTG